MRGNCFILFSIALAMLLVPRSFAADAQDKRTVPGIGMELIRVPAGTFTIGSPKSEHERYVDEPTPTEITLTPDFWLGKTEVTQGQWEALMQSNPSRNTRGGKDAPVEGVSWADAMAYCEKLTERERAAGRLPEGYIYTLPTETQWECACRAGTAESPYAGNLDEMAWYAKNGGIATHPVAQKQPNAWGFYDMHGNVWEWTSTWYNQGMLGRSATNPAGPTTGSLRVLRGGSFDMPAVPARSSYRLKLPPETAKGSIGFRVALTTPPVPEVPQPGGGRRGGRRGRGAQTQQAATQPDDLQQQQDDPNLKPPAEAAQQNAVQ